MANAKINNDSSVYRWRPDFRYIDNKFNKVEQKLFESQSPSDTDKEAYRVSLASLRGELAQGSGSPDVGSYSLKAGEEYNPDFDFSFLNRKDLTIVELDDYIKHYEKMIRDYDESLTQDIKVQLAKAEKIRQEMQKGTDNKNNDVQE